MRLMLVALGVGVGGRSPYKRVLGGIGTESELGFAYLMVGTKAQSAMEEPEQKILHQFEQPLSFLQTRNIIYSPLCPTLG